MGKKYAKYIALTTLAGTCAAIFYKHNKMKKVEKETEEYLLSNFEEKEDPPKRKYIRLPRKSQ